MSDARDKIGVIIPMARLLEEGADGLRRLGLRTCQLNNWKPAMATRENAARVRDVLGNDISIASLWAGWPPPAVWDFIDGPATLGLVPAAYRAERIVALKAGADLAHWLGLADVTTHVGFIPENPSTTEYRDVVVAIREVARYCRDLGLYFNFETGQETPITLMRTIEDVGLDNLGVNLDPANLLMYGKANPMDAVDIYRERVRGVHVKDGRYPTDGRRLGVETPVGEGLVDFPDLVRRLRKHGYDGAWIIEREISGPRQIEDIRRAREYLLSIL